MTTAHVTATESTPADSRRREPDVFPRLAELAQQYRAPTGFYRASLDVLATHFRSHVSAMHVCQPSASLDEKYATGQYSEGAWQRLLQSIILESQADERAIARLYDIDGTRQRIAILAVPLHDEQKYRGACALVVDCRDRRDAEAKLFELRTLFVLICQLASSIRPVYERAGGGADSQRALARAARFGSVTELAFAITNGMKTKFQCDQVALGKVRGGSIRLWSLSGMDGLYPRSPGSRLICQAMEECVDSGRTIYSRASNDWSASELRQDYRLHRQWRTAIGDAAVASIPLLVDQQCVAVLSVTRPGSVGFRGGELEEIEQLVSAYAPALQLVERATRGWLAQTRDTVREGLLWLVARNCWGRRVTALAVVALVTWFCFGTIDYHVSTPCQLKPSRLLHCAAPFEGILRTAHVDVGDVVEEGQLLFAMDTRDLELQRQELQSELAVLELEISQAAASQQLEPAALARAKMQVAQAKLSGIERRIELAEVRAPADGTIMAGDIEQREGDMVRLGDPLLEFAPHGSWEVDLQVRSSDAQLVSAGQTGRFATLARPDQTVACRVQRVEPAATVAGGKSVYVARAEIESGPDWSLAGMDGMATIEVGKRRVWWVVLHRALDYLRLHFWV